MRNPQNVCFIIQIYFLNVLKTHIQLSVARDTSPCDLYITTFAACYLDMVVQKRIVLEIYVLISVRLWNIKDGGS